MEYKVSFKLSIDERIWGDTCLSSYIDAVLDKREAGMCISDIEVDISKQSKATNMLGGNIVKQMIENYEKQQKVEGQQMKDITTIDGVKYKCIDTVVEDKAKTGYERVDKGEEYYTADNSGYICTATENDGYADDSNYARGNYHNDETIAENNARADRLFRLLRQWQALNDECVDRADTETQIYFIYYNHSANDIRIGYNTFIQESFTVYFSSEEKAEEAIEVFRNDLTWYFTEYQSRLDEPIRGGQEVNT